MDGPGTGSPLKAWSDILEALTQEEIEKQKTHGHNQVSSVLTTAKASWMNRANELLTPVLTLHTAFDVKTEKRRQKVDVQWKDRHIEQGQEIERLMSRGREQMSTSLLEASKVWEQRQTTEDRNITVARGPSFSKSRSERKVPVRVLFFEDEEKDDKDISSAQRFSTAGDNHSSDGSTPRGQSEPRNQLSFSRARALANKSRARSSPELPEDDSETRKNGGRGRSLDRAGGGSVCRFGNNGPIWNSTLMRFEAPKFDCDEADRRAAVFSEAKQERDSRFVESLVEEARSQATMREAMANTGSQARVEWKERVALMNQNGQQSTIAERPKFHGADPVRIEFNDRHMEQGQQILHDQLHGRSNLGAASTKARLEWEARAKSEGGVATIAQAPVFESERKHPIKLVSYADRQITQSEQVIYDQRYARRNFNLAGRAAKREWESRSAAPGGVATIAEAPIFESEKKYPIKVVPFADRHMPQSEKIKYHEVHGRREISSWTSMANSEHATRELKGELSTIAQGPAPGSRHLRQTERLSLENHCS